MQTFDLSSIHALQTPEGLQAFDNDFLHFLQQRDEACHQLLISYRRGLLDESTEFTAKALSLFLIDLSQYVEAYLTRYFDISDAVNRLHDHVCAQDPVIAFKKEFVLKRAKRRLNEALPVLNEIEQQLNARLLPYLKKVDGDRELAMAQMAQTALKAGDASTCDLMTDYAVHMLTNAEAAAAVAGWVSFQLPEKLDYAQLVPHMQEPNDAAGRLSGVPGLLRERDGFDLTDAGMTTREIQDQVNYCVYCHKNEGDFCSKGFPVKKKEPELGYKINPLDELLVGCPLEERISEMQWLRRDGMSIAALAMIMRDNPMCVLTGHRVCNDCMKACIYQKQAPVNIPEIETAVLKDVLHLPWGVELYDLLAKWNPLRRAQYLMQPYDGRKTLVMGMGPAGITLAHHLTMAGVAVVGCDGLKIEPIDAALLQQPIQHYADIQENLSTRAMRGFGGVAEYGITVRWDKNFLLLAYLTLARRAAFQVYGGVRFGGTLTIEKCWSLGFDHLAIAVGAGLPRELQVPGSLAPGMRQANDFLMALQLTGAAKADSLAALQIRLPAVVIGGGLTGIDTATELQAYYIKQCEKTAIIYHALCGVLGEDALREQFMSKELEILDEHLTHAAAIAGERATAKKEGRQPAFIALLRRWGGVTIVYRRTLAESPAYKRNHEEVAKAIQEGIYYLPAHTPKQVLLDQHGDCNKMVFTRRDQDPSGYWQDTDDELVLPARCIMVATGAKPNVAYAFEHEGALHREKFEYQSYLDEDGKLRPAKNNMHCKSDEFGAFTSYNLDDKRVTFLGDTHPVFHGSVVKAIASAQRVYPKVLSSCRASTRQVDHTELQAFIASMRAHFEAHVVDIEQLNPTVRRLTVRAPLAAEQYQTGQFYRVQPYQTSSVAPEPLSMNALPLLAIPVEGEPTQLSFVVKDKDLNFALLDQLKAGDPLVVMGPTGNRYKRFEKEHVVVVGDFFAAIQILATAKHLRAEGNRITWIATFPESTDLFLKDLFESLCDKVHWLTGADDAAIESALSKQWGSVVWAFGGTCLLKLVQRLRAAGKVPQLDNASFIASVYGPMQCMLKGVCAQCLQWQIDPVTGERKKAVYACSWHHQPLELVDIDNLGERLSQDSAQTKLYSLYWKKCRSGASFKG